MRRLLPLVTLFTSLAACSADTPPASPAPAPMPPFRHEAFYETLQGDAEHFTQLQGDWVEDYGDAAFYGLAFYARTGAETGDPARLGRAGAARARSVALLEDADLLNGDINEFAMSAFGLIDAIDASGDPSGMQVLDDFIDRLDTLVRTLGYYLDGLSDQSWAFDTYGVTAVSALLGLINAQYAHQLGGERAPERTEWARQMAAAISDHAWNGTIYEFGGSRDIECIYPNIAMILLNTRLFQLTGEEGYRERALATYRGIQPFKLPGEPVRYRSPYSAEAMGAKTDDYWTLSSQNYLLLALMTLAEITGDPAYALEADSVIDALSTELHGTWCLSDRHDEVCAPSCGEEQVCLVDSCAADTCQGGVLHHWIDGRPALPTDPEFICSGCNLQLLYVLWYRQHLAP
jgi:hypothetical protein